MAEIIFKFDTSGDDGIWEREEANRCMKSLDLCLCISDILEMLKNKRNLTEYGPDVEQFPALADQNYELIDDIINGVFEIMGDRAIDLDELVS